MPQPHQQTIPTPADIAQAVSMAPGQGPEGTIPAKAPEATRQAPSEPETAAAQQVPTEQKPPWDGEDFDPERAWKLVQNLRGEIADLKTAHTPPKDPAPAPTVEQQDTAQDPARTKSETDSGGAHQLSQRLAKTEALVDANLPRNLVGLIPDGEPDDIAAAVAALADLRGQPEPATRKSPRPDPAQVATPATDPREEFVTHLFGR